MNHKNGARKLLKDNDIEDVITYYIFAKNGWRHFDPQYLSAGMTAVRWIFPLPLSNTVGTLDERSNGIASITFGDYSVEPVCNVIAKDYGDKIYDLFHYRFSPNFTDDAIAYSQNRVAVIANIKTGEAFYAGCGLSRNDCMLGIRFLNPQENLFVIAKSIDEGGSGKTISKL